MESHKMNKNIITFDYAKLFFAICVVALHTQAFSCISPVFDNYLAKMLYCLAVPFFFFVSGYLLHDNLSFSKDDVFVIKKRIARLLKPYILFSIINILLYIIKSSLYDGDSFNHIALKIIQSIISLYPRIPTIPANKANG